MGRSRQSLTIEHAILGFLREQPLHGYELYQRLIAPTALGSVWPLKQSQFYALLARLEAEGYLAVTREPRGSQPARKLLALTPAGALAFTTWLVAPSDPADDRERAFLARLFFARQLGPAAVHQLLTSQRQQLRSWLQALRRTTNEAVTPHSYAWLVGQWQIRQAEAMLDWLDSFGPLPTLPAITYRIAALVDSPGIALAQQFVAFARGSEGQAVLARSGFLPAGELLPEATLPAPTLLAGRLTIYAASSLTAAFEQLAAAFTALHPDVQVQCSFGGSQTLAEALAQGAHADVFAPAHEDALATAVAAGRVAAESIRALCHNQLAIVTSAQRPAALRTLSDLARPGLRLALGSEATAIGRYAHEALSIAEQQGVLGNAGAQAVLHNVVHYAETVTGVLAKVAQGDVDAGIVFTSDYYRAGGAVQVAAVPPLR
jgi:molybdate transport system substrate-binding protein